MSNNSNMEFHRHELLADVEQQVKTVLKEFNIDSDKAEHAGTTLANYLANHWGGQVIIFPKDYKWKVANRDMLIWNDFNGTNHSELARKYGITTRGVYGILKKVGDRVRSKDQPSLF